MQKLIILVSFILLIFLSITVLANDNQYCNLQDNQHERCREFEYHCNYLKVSLIKTFSAHFGSIYKCSNITGINWAHTTFDGDILENVSHRVYYDIDLNDGFTAYCELSLEKRKLFQKRRKIKYASCHHLYQ